MKQKRIHDDLNLNYSPSFFKMQENFKNSDIIFVLEYSTFNSWIINCYKKKKMLPLYNLALIPVNQ